MGEGVQSLSPAEPRKWLLIFSTKAATWWSSLAACGHYKHVRAIGQIPRTDLWILYDVQLGRTQIAVGPFREILDLAAPANYRTDLMWFAPLPARRFFPPAFLCTTAIAHLIGVKCVARPDALWKVCLLNGGECVSHGGYPQTVATGAKPAV
jgi:hypothetical protein